MSLNIQTKVVMPSKSEAYNKLKTSRYLNINKTFKSARSCYRDGLIVGTLGSIGIVSMLLTKHFAECGLPACLMLFGTRAAEHAGNTYKELAPAYKEIYARAKAIHPKN